MRLCCELHLGRWTRPFRCNRWWFFREFHLQDILRHHMARQSFSPSCSMDITVVPTQGKILIPYRDGSRTWSSFDFTRRRRLTDIICFIQRDILATWHYCACNSDAKTITWFANFSSGIGNRRKPLAWLSQNHSSKVPHIVLFVLFVPNTLVIKIKLKSSYSYFFTL